MYFLIPDIKLIYFYVFFCPWSNIYHVFAIVVFLMSEKTVDEACQTATKAEHNGKPEEGMEVEYHHQTSYS